VPIFEPRDQARAAQATYLVTDILSDQTARSRSFGEESILHLDGVAAKTGTTKDFRDNWAFGYTTDLALGVWTGNADDSPMDGVNGITGAVPIWRDIFQTEMRFARPIKTIEPDGLVRRDICVTSGLLATPECPKTRTELFMAGTEPRKADTWYRSLAIDPVSGRLATARCPSSTTKTFLVLPPEYHDWAESAHIDQPPAYDCDGRKTTIASTLRPMIVSPLDGDVYQPDPRVDPSTQRIPFVAGSSCIGGCVWTIDGKPIRAAAATYLWDPVPGEHVLGLSGADRPVRFEVK